ncbi:MAG: hypothetical protein JWO86_4538, partial [Myxococcaceae bacterium]|nr:hypothetical protein [Myxococcaceae bacterium]
MRTLNERSPVPPRASRNTIQSAAGVAP